MICEEASMWIGAAPGESTPELRAHLATCANCSALHAEALRLDERIHRAMQLVPPGMGAVASPASGSVAVLPPRAAPVRVAARRGWALAASILLAVAAGFLWWPAQSGPVSASELLQHVGGSEEQGSWDNTAVVPEGVLDKVLQNSGVSLERDPKSPVVYAHSCVIRGRRLPHLVILTASGPVTVVPMPGEQLEAAQDFDENGLRGVLLPLTGGAVAVIGRGQMDVQRLAPDIGRRIRLPR